MFEWFKLVLQLVNSSFCPIWKFVFFLKSSWHPVTCQRGCGRGRGRCRGPFCIRRNIGHITTMACHPEGNDMVERTHRRLKDALRAHCSGLDWANHLPWVLMGLGFTPQEDTGLSLAQAVLGTSLAQPADRPDAQPPERPLEQELETLHTIHDAASGPQARCREPASPENHPSYAPGRRPPPGPSQRPRAATLRQALRGPSVHTLVLHNPGERPGRDKPHTVVQTFYPRR